MPILGSYWPIFTEYAHPWLPIGPSSQNMPISGFLLGRFSAEELAEGTAAALLNSGVGDDTAAATLVELLGDAAFELVSEGRLSLVGSGIFPEWPHSDCLMWEIFGEHLRKLHGLMRSV
jgi:hypothetical protein